jgi:hypothetical protein
VVSRRTLLAAGGAAVLLGGCGEEDEPAAPSAADALLRSLAAERALAAAARDRIAARARERARQLASAVSEEGGRPHDAPADAEGGDAAAAARAALVAHVDALPPLGRDQRALMGELIVGAAADLAALTGEAEPFPGTPS